MRPILVLLLVAAAVGAFVFTMNLGNEGDDPVPGIAGPKDRETLVAENPGQGEVKLTDVGRIENREASDPVAVPERIDVVSDEARLGNSIRGRVQLEDGTRLRDVTVTLARHDPFSLLGSPADAASIRSTTTTGNGEFVFTDVEAYTEYAVTAFHPKFGRRQEAPIQIADGASIQLSVVLEPGARLHGMVTDSGGNTVGGAILYLGMAGLGSVASDANTVAVKSSPDGSYEFLNVPDNNYSLEVVAEGYGRVLLQQLNVSGKEDHEQDIVLDVAHMIEGSVVDTTGAPIVEAKVQAWSAGGRDRQTRSEAASDDQGRFLLDDVRAGVYTLFVSAPGFKNERKMRVETGEMNVQVQLTPLPRVRGQVLDSQGAPVKNFTVNLRVPVQNTEDTIALRDTSIAVKNAVNGEFEIACPNQGEYVVEVQRSPYAPTLSDRFTIANGSEVAGLVIRLTAGGSIVGRVVDWQGNPVAGARLQTHDTEYVDDPFFRSLGQYPSAATEMTGKTREDGTFVLQGLTPETYQIDVRHKDHAQLIHQNVVVREGAETDVGDLKLSAGAVIEGTVVGAGGQPLAGATVQLRGTGDEPHNYPARTDADGRYRVEHVAPGSYLIYAQRTGDPNNPFLGATDMKKTQRNIVISEGQSYSEDFAITN